MIKIEYETEKGTGRSLTKCKHYDILVGTGNCFKCKHRDLWIDQNKGKFVYCNYDEKEK